MKSETNRVRISSSAHLKPAPVAGFIVFEQNSANTMTKRVSSYYFKKPVLRKQANGIWYIEYYYRIPFDLKEVYDNKKWLRFRIKKDINRHKGIEKEEYADWLLNEITNSLRYGYDPFKPDKIIKQEVDELEARANPETDDPKVETGIHMFLDHCDSRNLDASTISRYKRTCNYFLSWLASKGRIDAEIVDLTSDDVQSFLMDLKNQRNISNREYNNQYDFTRTLFNFFVKKKFLTNNLMADIPKLKTKTTKHRYYDTLTLKKLIQVMESQDAYLLFAFQTVYYLCIRAEKELMHLKTENILWDENRILIEVGKGNSERYIPMDKYIKGIFIEREIDKYPHGLYVFGVHGKPSERPFGKGFLSKRFRKIRELAGLNPAYTLYSAKHTRVIHLKQENLTDADIMSLTGHKDFTAYAKYLRDIGMEANPDMINKVTRKL